MPRALLSLALILLTTAPGLLAWNATGHKAITFLAYSHLTPKARQRVDLLLRAHPDFATILAKTDSTDPIDVTRVAFTIASTWPDIIKGDQRFVDSPGASPKPLPGFPDMMRHQSWHYINMPVPSEFKDEAVDPVNALVELKRMLKVLHKDGPATPEEVYALPWILHLITDVHQPLHTVSRFFRVNGKVDQDRGGNLCFLQDDRNLHSLWDNVLGFNADEGNVARLAASMEDHLAQPKKVDVKPDTWIREGIDVANRSVYTFPGNCSDRNAPLKLPADYKPKARLVALDRGAMAAYRVAAILNEAFK